MRGVAIPLIVVAGFLIGADDAKKEDLAKKDRESLQGSWHAVALENNGEKRPEEEIKKVHFTIKGDQWTIHHPDGSTNQGSFRLNPTKKPKEIDVVSDKGETYLGLYQMEGDELKFCFSEPGQDRPKSFTTKPPPWRLNVYQRDKK